MKNIHFKRIAAVVGCCVLVESIFELFSLLVGCIYYESEVVPLLISFFIILLCGLLLFIPFKKEMKKDMSRKDSFLIVVLAWVSISFFGSLPYLLTNSITNFTDAFFETVSGFTTTGSSIVTDIEALPKSILFWRAETHWLGGMGIIVLVLAILPYLKKSGINLMVAEGAFLSDDKIKPKIADVAKRFWLIYVIFTFLETVFLRLGGMNWFDSLCHSFATIATGGFSTYNTSLIDCSSYIQYVVIFFMLISGMNFALHYKLIFGNSKSIFKNEELKAYLFIIFIVSVLISFNVLSNYGNDFEESFRQSLFQVVSIITATGFASADYELWPVFSISLIFFVMFIGACVGSTGGGIKVARYVVVFKKINLIFQEMVSPHKVSVLKYNNHAVNVRFQTTIGSFIILYFVTFLVGSIFMTLCGLDIKSAASSVITTLGGIGPGLGDVGPTDNFSGISVIGKLYLSFNMIIGRLEIIPFFVLLSKSFYR